MTGMMEQKQIYCSSVFDQLPPLYANCPCLVVQNLEDTRNHTFYTIPTQPCHYRCRSPELLGKRIQGYYHGWVILSHKAKWSLWNPATGKILNHIPPLILKDGDSEFRGQCCLSSPPDDPSSILLLTRSAKPTFVFCRLDSNIKWLRWTEISYARELKRITSYYGLLRCPTIYNGKVYALYTTSVGYFVIQVDIVIKDGDVVIKPLLFKECPSPSFTPWAYTTTFLKGSCTELFYIRVGFQERTRKIVRNVYLFKWLMSSMSWEETDDLKDAIFFADLGRDYSVYYSQPIASELGGYIHLRDEMGKVIYSYHFKDKTISISSMPSAVLPTSQVSLWESRLKGDHGEAMCTLHSKQEDNEYKIAGRSVIDDEVRLTESTLFDIPLHLLENIMERHVGVEYMYFRATCKRCHLAAPSIQWSNKAALRRLHNYSVASPWLMEVDEYRGIYTFTDPMFGDKYSMKRPEVSPGHDRLFCSRFGWVLYSMDPGYLKLFNPFTKDTHDIPFLTKTELDAVSFSAPPTSPDCMIFGFTYMGSPKVFMRYKTCRMSGLDFGDDCPASLSFPTFVGPDIYALSNDGQLFVFKNFPKVYWKKVAAKISCDGQYFLVQCKQNLLLVTVGKSGESVEVFKLNVIEKKWEKIDSLGRHMIYICSARCLCLEAKIPGMENKIYFPRFHVKNGKIVFYSLETGRYHIFKDKNIEEISGTGIEYVRPHIWIEPSWS